MHATDWQFPYASQRMPVLAKNIVATSQPLAAQAGLRMLLKGGNAVDAALATAIAATVVEPVANGIGGDAFALVWDGKKVHGLNASGRSPQAWTPDRFKGLSAMPTKGWDSVVVPGAVSAWVELSKRFGKLAFAELFVPAIEYARHGFHVSPTISRQWHAQVPLLFDQPGFSSAFLPAGQAPGAGQIFAFPAQADTLSAIAQTYGETFYRGEIAEKIVADSRLHGGALTYKDFADHRPFWVEPISHQYRDLTLHEIPPNGQGLAALIALGILNHLDIRGMGIDTAESIHAQIEATKLAFADVYAHVADPKAMALNSSQFLDPDYLSGRAKLINMEKAQWPGTGYQRSEGTVYLAAADSNGMMVSYIQSNFRGFGSGVVVPETGISMGNRGSGFSLDPDHPNVVGGGKLPFHTIIRGFVTKNDEAVMSFGVMGANMQPQGHVQMMTRLADFGQNMQAASDAPRWKITEDQLGLMVEPGFDEKVLEQLASRGHRLIFAPRESTEFGAAQLIFRLNDGYLGASERRRDGQAVGF